MMSVGTGGERERYDECVKDGLVVSQVFCLPSSYRKDVPPQTDGPLNVFFKLPVTEISQVDDHKSQLTVRLSYKLRWPEHRMLLNDSADWSKGEINVRPDMINYFWTPDIIIHDLIKFNKPQVLNTVAALEIIQDHSVYYKIRSDITIVCKGMQFPDYPMDHHVCLLKLSSYGYDDTRMKLSGKFYYNKANQRVLAFHTDIQELSEKYKVFQGTSRNFSVYGMELILRRSLSPFILSIYLPSSMFVAMSWVSFFIPPDIVPARIVLLVTLCLVLINMFNSTTARIPVANSITAVEVWILACILLVFFTLLEYALILREVVTAKRTSQGDSESERQRRSSVATVSCVQVEMELMQSVSKASLPEVLQQRSPTTPPNNNSSNSKTEEQREDFLHHQKINWDQQATIVFPLIFLVFNISYWLHYLCINKL